MKLRRDVSDKVISDSTTPNYQPNSTSSSLPTNYQDLLRHLLSDPQQCWVPNNDTLVARRLNELEDLDVAQCADFALHISLVVFLTVMIVSCVYVCRKPARRKIKTMSVEVQTDDNIEIYPKDTSSSPTSSPPLERERQKLMRPLSEVRPAFLRQVSATETRNHIPPSPLATSDLATSICSLQSATSSHLRNHRKLLKKSTTMVAFPSNTLQNILTSDSYRKLASNNTISTAADAADPLNRRRRITVATQPGLNLNHTNSSHNLTSHNITLGPPASAYRYTYKPISGVFSTSDSNLSEKSSPRKKDHTRFVTRPVD